MENAKNLVSTAYPSLQVRAGGQDAAYLSYGGFMGGWAALSVGQWSGENKRIRYLGQIFYNILWNILNH